MIFTYLKDFFKKSSLLRLAFWALIIIPGVPFILGSLGFVIYAFWPRDISDVTTVEIDPATTYISISAHGVKDNAANWSDTLQQAMAIRGNGMSGSQQNISLDWRPFSDNPFICSIMAKRIGKALGEKIALSSNVNSIHAIGHSCGAFVVLGLCEGVKTRGGDITIQTTYLDPVSIYAGFFWQYGIEHFGACADFSDAYIDTEDTVPGSNQRLRHAHTFDVTQVRITHDIDEAPHNWPTRYYLGALSSGKVPRLNSTSEKTINALYPKGELTRIMQ